MTRKEITTKEDLMKIIELFAIGSCLRKSNFPIHIILKGSSDLLVFLRKVELESIPVSLISKLFF